MSERERDTHKRENRVMNVLARGAATTRQLWQVGGRNEILGALWARSFISGPPANPCVVGELPNEWYLTHGGERERENRYANRTAWTV